MIAKSEIERTYGYQILSGLKNPGRDKVIALCISLGCELEDAQKALIFSGSAPLYSKNRRDAILVFALSRHLTVADTNTLLAEFEADALS